MEKFMISKLGDLNDWQWLYFLLNELYENADVKTDKILSAKLNVAKMLLVELEAGNTEFFAVLAKMIPVARDKLNGPAPIESSLLFIKGVREGTFAERFSAFAEMFSGARLESRSKYRHEQAKYDHEKAKRMFPVWPATIKELHAYVSRGIKCDEKTIRDAVKRLGYPVRAGKMGAPKKK